MCVGVVEWAYACGAFYPAPAITRIIQLYYVCRAIYMRHIYILSSFQCAGLYLMTAQQHRIYRILPPKAYISNRAHKLNFSISSNMCSAARRCLWPYLGIGRS